MPEPRDPGPPREPGTCGGDSRGSPCRGDCHSVPPRRRKGWSFLKKLKAGPAYNPAVPLLSLHAEEGKQDPDEASVPAAEEGRPPAPGNRHRGRGPGAQGDAVPRGQEGNPDIRRDGPGGRDAQ